MKMNYIVPVTEQTDLATAQIICGSPAGPAPGGLPFAPVDDTPMSDGSADAPGRGTPIE